MQKDLVMSAIYFEEKGAELLKIIGMKKTEFAHRMGIKKQNVNTLFKTKNIETIRKAAEVLGVRFEMLIEYTAEPDLEEIEFLTNNDASAYCCLIQPDDIPSGNSKEDKRVRQDIIHLFYDSWRKKNPELKKLNLNLGDFINIRFVSIDETAAHASLKYLSTLAVLQLDAILTNAVLVRKTPSKSNNKNQRQFESMLIMQYNCVGVGLVKMTVGVRRSDKLKVQYCITAMSVDTQKKNGR